MAKIYAKKNVVVKSLQPKSETITFLLNYSKALSVKKVGKIRIAIIAN